MLKKILACMLVAAVCFAWDGYDWEKGGFVEIEKNNLVRSGKDIEIYDYSDGKYKDLEVLSINRMYGGKVELEVYDYEDGKERTLEMDSYQDKKDKYFKGFPSDNFLDNQADGIYGDTFFK